MDRLIKDKYEISDFVSGNDCYDNRSGRPSSVFKGDRYVEDRIEQLFGEVRPIAKENARFDRRSQ